MAEIKITEHLRPRLWYFAIVTAKCDAKKETKKQRAIDLHNLHWLDDGAKSTELKLGKIFVDLTITNINQGYEKHFLSQSLQTMLVLPFFLFLMTAIASILTMHTLKRSENFKFIVLGLIICVLVYYFKDLSLALGKIDRIPINLGIWSPIIALSLFTFVGILQINEK